MCSSCVLCQDSKPSCKFAAAVDASSCLEERLHLYLIGNCGSKDWGRLASQLSLRRGRGARLVESRGKEVQRCKDAAVGAEVVLFHDVLIVHLRGTLVVYAKKCASAPGSSLRACCCCCKQRTVSRMSILGSYGVSKTAGSKLMR